MMKASVPSWVLRVRSGPKGKEEDTSHGAGTTKLSRASLKKSRAGVSTAWQSVNGITRSKINFFIDALREPRSPCVPCGETCPPAEHSVSYKEERDVGGRVRAIPDCRRRTPIWLDSFLEVLSSPGGEVRVL